MMILMDAYAREARAIATMRARGGERQDTRYDALRYASARYAMVALLIRLPLCRALLLALCGTRRVVARCCY